MNPLLTSFRLGLQSWFLRKPAILAAENDKLEDSQQLSTDVAETRQHLADLHPTPGPVVQRADSLLQRLPTKVDTEYPRFARGFRRHTYSHWEGLAGDLIWMKEQQVVLAWMKLAGIDWADYRGHKEEVAGAVARVDVRQATVRLFGLDEVQQALTSVSARLDPALRGWFEKGSLIGWCWWDAWCPLPLNFAGKQPAGWSKLVSAASPIQVNSLGQLQREAPEGAGWPEFLSRYVESIASNVGAAIPAEAAAGRQSVGRSLASDPVEPDGVYAPDRVRLQGKDCTTLSPTQIRIVQFMFDKGSAPKQDVVNCAWGKDSSVEDGALRTMLDKMNSTLRLAEIRVEFHFRKGHVVKE